MDWICDVVRTDQGLMWGGCVLVTVVLVLRRTLAACPYVLPAQCSLHSKSTGRPEKFNADARESDVTITFIRFTSYKDVLTPETKLHSQILFQSIQSASNVDPENSCDQANLVVTVLSRMLDSSKDITLL
ncbi:hypothetical protein BaRGS_00021454 [Batillaria attramentaria]|uniref:Uncharacterized protein n=1 Tax=Batillaria attramentaria TaxID=370345 RepID=A0ABD0KJJ0_9CAEN